MRRKYVVLIAMTAGCGSSSTPHPAADAPPVDTAQADAPSGRFAAKVDFSTAPNPEAVALVDVDGDGKLDLVVANTNDASVSVLLGITASGSSTPIFRTRVDFATGSAPVSLAIADFNGDGKPDIATANVGAGTVSILLGTTQTGATVPTFAAAVDFATGMSPEYVTAGDFDHDGKPDLAVANFGSSTVSILVDTTTTGAASPSFAAAVALPTGAGPVAVAAGDLDGDGLTDVVTANLTAGTVSVLRNTTMTGPGAPTFATAADTATGAGDVHVVAVDLDGDGKLDLAVTNGDDATISVLVNTSAAGSPRFAAKVDVPTGAGPNFMAIGHFGGSGLDIAVTDFGDNQVAVLENISTPGAPAFSPRTTYATGQNPRSIATGDINGDGKLDLAVANSVGNTVSVLMAR